MTLMNFRRAGLFPLITALTVGTFGGCASTTMIQSQPTGARVSLNGAVVGNTPYLMTDTKIVGSTTVLRLEYPGYQPLDASISRNEQVDVLALIGGLLLLFPFLWIMEYQPLHVYQLQPAYGAPGSYPAPPGYPPPPPGYPPPGYPPAPEQPSAPPARGYPPAPR